MSVDLDALPTPGACVYRFYSEADRLLYVGLTRDPPVRFGQHEKAKAWWHEISRITLQRYPDMELAAAAEALAIRTEAPKYNVRGLATGAATRCKGADRAYFPLREARRRLGLTQAQLASVLGLTREAVSRYERGVLRITPLLEFAIRYLEDRTELLPTNGPA